MFCPCQEPLSAGSRLHSACRERPRSFGMLSGILSCQLSSSGGFGVLCMRRACRNQMILRLYELEKDRANKDPQRGRSEPVPAISERSLLSDSLCNANILRRNPAKELLAFLPATTNPQEPNPRPPTFTPSLGLLQALRSAGRVPFLSQTHSLAAVFPWNSVQALGVHTHPPFPPQIPVPSASRPLHLTCKASS